MNIKLLTTALCIALLCGVVKDAFAQAEVMAWGNITGIRVDGQLMPFETSFCVLNAKGVVMARTAKERQPTTYTREGDVQKVSTVAGPVSVTQEIRNTGEGTATVHVVFTAEKDTTMTGAYFCIDVPDDVYSEGTVALVDPTSPITGEISLAGTPTGRNGEFLHGVAWGVRFASPERQLNVAFATPADVIVRKEDDLFRAYVAVMPGNAVKGQTAERTFMIEATGEIDRSPVTLTLDARKPGRAFDGIGGNFRLQNPNNDPKVIDFNLENLRVAWARVEMPWSLWHPEEDVDPYEAAVAGQLNPRVQAAMEMARRLSRMGMPVVVSAWFAPEWAIVGPRQRGPRPDGLNGNPLRQDKMDKIYASITSYLQYLKDYYGVEAVMFSFNESDIGIDVLQTAEEHRDLIKGLGAYFASNGLATKMLLGDTGDATATEFIKPTMADPEAWRYVGAVSFHSWRGWTDELLSYWGEAAKKLNVPLLVGEGSTDAAAWRYPQIFLEPTFAHQEIDLYVRMLALCEPLSILQWQLTSDYSLLIGEGIFRTEGPLRPLQRFWNIKQLASTPAGAFHLPIEADKEGINSAAFGNIANGEYAVHIVNNGAGRPATIAGFPEGLTELRVYVTDAERAMEEVATIPVTNGMAELTLLPVSFTTLMGEVEQVN